MDMSTCGTTKGCLFAPPECKPSADCGIVFTYKVDGKYLNIELTGKAPSPNGFVAVGFSKDDQMVGNFVHGLVGNTGMKILE
ncbi:unnamed protein product [Angiostrongylus costaricensis]|uniref:DOMON domain-containing protein n=1 Tax=Angiostrongylus costaricensis TaxID=334426 RepID=A0A0R3PQQ3_ANGCS|nr:unnamed protein product [Angiostrongylus costaricensis]